jgi:hypothetical protein
MGNINVLINPSDRERYVQELLALDGLSGIVEDQHAAYCLISLTSTPNELKPILMRRQELLMRRVLEPVGIKAYDPASAPFSPDQDLSTQPNEVYAVDSGKIAGARYFVGHNIIPSTGQGIEAEKAKFLNRIVVMIMDRNIRVSRMQPHRAIYLQYNNFEDQLEDFQKVFKLLDRYDPGIGLNGSLPALLGFEKEGGGIVDLEDLIYNKFPHLKYEYDGAKSIAKLSIDNPEIFKS